MVQEAAPGRPAAYSMAEAARQLSVSRPFLYKLIAEGKLQSRTIGRRRLIPSSEVFRLIEEQPDDAA